MEINKQNEILQNNSNEKKKIKKKFCQKERKIS